jgi:hypothetical protein
VAQRVGRGIALLFHDHDTRRGRVVSSTPRPYFTPGKDPVPIVQEAGWTPGSVWTYFTPGKDPVPFVQGAGLAPGPVLEAEISPETLVPVDQFSRRDIPLIPDASLTYKAMMLSVGLPNFNTYFFYQFISISKSGWRNRYSDLPRAGRSWN